MERMGLDRRLFRIDNQNDLETVVLNQGVHKSFTIEAGGSQGFDRPCGSVQAVEVKGDLQIIGGLGPSRSTEVLRDGTDFGCGDRLTFTFTSPDPLTLGIDFTK